MVGQNKNIINYIQSMEKIYAQTKSMISAKLECETKSDYTYLIRFKKLDLCVALIKTDLNNLTKWS